MTGKQGGVREDVLGSTNIRVGSPRRVVSVSIVDKPVIQIGLGPVTCSLVLSRGNFEIVMGKKIL